MAKEPGDRYRTAGDLACDLRAASAPAAPTKRGRMGVGIAIAAGLLATALGVTYFTGAWPFNITRPNPNPGPDDRGGVVPGSPRVFRKCDLRSDGILRDLPEDQSLQPGDGLNLKLFVEPQGYVYVFHFKPSDSREKVERLYPSDVDKQAPVTNVAVPAPDRVFDLAMDGPEMILIGASRKPLSAAMLKKLQNLAIPKLDTDLEALWQHTKRTSERNRAQTPHHSTKTGCPRVGIPIGAGRVLRKRFFRRNLLEPMKARPKVARARDRMRITLCAILVLLVASSIPATLRRAISRRTSNSIEPANCTSEAS